MKNILKYIQQIQNKYHNSLVFSSPGDKKIFQSNIFEVDGTQLLFTYNKADGCYYQCN